MKRVRAILTFLRKKDQHAELLLYVWQLQHLQAEVTDIVEGQLFLLVHHLHWPAIILMEDKYTYQ